jgi:hypothetical protein
VLGYQLDLIARLGQRLELEVDHHVLTTWASCGIEAVDKSDAHY